MIMYFIFANQRLYISREQQNYTNLKQERKKKEVDDNIHRNVLITVECSSSFESSHIEIPKTLSEDCAVRNLPTCQSELIRESG